MIFIANFCQEDLAVDAQFVLQPITIILPHEDTRMRQTSDREIANFRMRLGDRHELAQAHSQQMKE